MCNPHSSSYINSHANAEIFQPYRPKAETLLKQGIYKILHKEGLLTDTQLNNLLAQNPESKTND